MNFEDFDKPLKEEPHGSMARYQARLDRFQKDGQPWPRLRHHTLWVLHNCIVHPILAVCPKAPVVEVHDLTSQWLNQSPAKSIPERQYPVIRSTLGLAGMHSRTIVAKVPEVKKPVAWFVHNAVAHTLIGVLPCRLTFAFHDRTAETMGIRGWL